MLEQGREDVCSRLINEAKFDPVAEAESVESDERVIRRVAVVAEMYATAGNLLEQSLATGNGGRSPRFNVVQSNAC